MTTAQQKSSKILLLGDFCVDETYILSPGKPNPENSSPLFNNVKYSMSSGMAGNVFECLKSLGLTEVIFIRSESEPIKKSRYYTYPFEPYCRIDSDVYQKPINLDKVNFSEFDCVVISDYNKGSVTDETILTVLHSCNVPIFLDTKKTNLSTFNGCIIKINEIEYNSAVTIPDNNLIVTLGSKGCFYDKSIISTKKVKAVDVCGAGDAFLAGLVYGWLITKDINSSIPYGLANATTSVQHAGCYRPSENELLKEIAND